MINGKVGPAIENIWSHLDRPRQLSRRLIVEDRVETPQESETEDIHIESTRDCVISDGLNRHHARIIHCMHCLKVVVRAQSNLRVAVELEVNFVKVIDHLRTLAVNEQNATVANVGIAVGIVRG